MAKRFDIETRFRAIDKFTVPISRMQSKMSRFTRRISSSLRMINRRVNAMGAGMKKFARGIGIATIAIGLLAANIIGVGASFDQAIVSATVKFPAVMEKGVLTPLRRGTEAFKAVSDAARKAGRETQFSAVEAANGMNFLAMAGFTAEAAIKSLPIVIDLATVAEVDLARATDIATDSLGAFNLASTDATVVQKNLGRVVDILAQTSVSANTSLEEMFETVRNGAPAAVAAGQSIETVAALTAKMADSGIKGTKAGTGLKNIMLAISDQSSVGAKLFKKFGVATVDASGNVLDAVDIFDSLNAAMVNLGTAEKVTAFKTLFGKLSIAAAINLTNAAKSTRTFRDMLIATTGTAKTLSDVLRGTTENKIKSFNSAIESLKISIFLLNQEGINRTIDSMTLWVRANEKMIASGLTEFLTKVVPKVVAFAKSIFENREIIIKTTATIAALVIGLKILIGVMTLVNLVMLANPIVLIALAVILLIAQIVILVFWWDEFNAMMDNLPAWAQGLITLLFPIVALARAANLIIENWEPIKAFFKGLWEGIISGAARVERILRRISPALSIQDRLGGVGGPFGFGGGEATGERAEGDDRPQMVSPNESIRREIREERTHSSADITIKTAGELVAELTRGSLGAGVILQPSADF